MPIDPAAPGASTVIAGVPSLSKIVVIGVGLIGGSFALAQKSAGQTATIVGVGRGQANLDEAMSLGIVDRAVTLDADWTADVADADLVLLAAPVAQFAALFAALAGCLGPRTVITDAGSTKQDVIAAARGHLGAAWTRFVPGHPIAGTERTGAKAAHATLFKGRNVVLTPMPATDPDAVRRVAGLWRECGAQVRELEAGVHDRIFAAVSHLPHLLAFALVEELAMRPDAEEFFRYAASGFRDFTRIAASSPEMWRDIALSNRDALLAEVAAFRAQLDRMAAMLDARDGAALEAVFARASTARRAWGADRGTTTGVPADGPRET